MDCLVSSLPSIAVGCMHSDNHRSVKDGDGHHIVNLLASNVPVMLIDVRDRQKEEMAQLECEVRNLQAEREFLNRDGFFSYITGGAADDTHLSIDSESQTGAMTAASRPSITSRQEPSIAGEKQGGGKMAYEERDSFKLKKLFLEEQVLLCNEEGRGKQNKMGYHCNARAMHLTAG